MFFIQNEGIPLCCDAREPSFFLNLHFHVAVAENVLSLMRVRKMLYMTYMLVSHALFFYSTLALLSLGKKAKGIS
jgi:hypothetical protein